MSDIYDRLKSATAVGSTLAETAGACEAALHELLARDAEIERRAKSIEEAMTQLAWKDDEIEKLRGLLRECLPFLHPDTAWDFDGDGGWLDDRVREALGE